MRFPDDVPTLTDGLVTLRAHDEGDVPALLEQGTDPAMVAWTTVPVPASEESARVFATEIIPAGWERGTSWAFAVEAADETGTPRFCGTVELHDRGALRAEIAFSAHPCARGRGLMERACRLLLEWGFRTQRLETVIWWAHQGNWASRRLAWRLGFSCDGTVRRWLTQRGDLRDAWVGVLLHGEPREPRTPWLDAPRIDGPTVSLRPFRAGDVPRVVEACQDPTTQHWLSRMPSPYTRADAEAYLETRREQLASAEGVSWAVADPATDELLGALSLFDLRPGATAEVGYWAHPDVRGRGVMTAAVRLAVRHAFVPVEDGGLGLHRLTVLHADGNVGSQRVIERNGFTYVGREREQARLRDGTYVDHLAYDLLAREFRP
ncbi:GNAT family N-acetyltransferase [Nocardioides iriomotensis]|uniref:N-acetyltransferase n=1 Tax=Nocardioides iriomotensis TaxID=715784 RepID=A0A4Q5J4U4_9ACTN|nr:GNAT family N-acetyltransferase [Nocardioides iriomotensis]RYU12738.1 N-acetyltransferase [Nocardioides iriomotensis]